MSTHSAEVEGFLHCEMLGRGHCINGHRLTPGKNVDPVDVSAGMAMLIQCGYDDPHTAVVIEYALQRWARGEEAQAERGAIDKSFHGISMTSWRMVLAAAVANGTAALVEAKRNPT